MGVPILEQGDVLIASIQDALTDAELVQLRNDLVLAVGERRSRGVVIDVTALDVMDSFACATLRAMATAIGLRGARTVVVGIQPDVAFAMVQLGLTLGGTRTALDLVDGLALLRAPSASRTGGR
jgi:rsbT antagonist protein RsbS